MEPQSREELTVYTVETSEGEMNWNAGRGVEAERRVGRETRGEVVAREGAVATEI